MEIIIKGNMPLERNEMENEYKYGIFRKHDERAIIKCRTREEAERLRRTNFIECEVKPL